MRSQLSNILCKKLKYLFRIQQNYTMHHALTILYNPMYAFYYLSVLYNRRSDLSVVSRLCVV